LLLNIGHLCEALFVEKFDLSQAVLLSFVLVINVLLILELLRGVKAKNIRRGNTRSDKVQQSAIQDVVIH
ncbi:MAG: hypothetical protein LBR84_06405, partial [Tannerella sp.]|nr:hypothetical protein [Tannerella sp.]